jgi:ATP diphosphatase
MKPSRDIAALIDIMAALRTLKLQEKAGKVGFDWNDPRAVLSKIREEADEIEAALDAGDREMIVRADPEAVLRATNQKFERRFASIERALAARGKTPRQATLAEMDALWDAAKAEK